MPDLLRSAAAFGIFHAMLAALRDEALAAPLRGPGPWTLLVVPDDAFALPADEPNEAFLRRHVLTRRYDAWELAQLRGVYTWGGERLPVHAGSRLTVGGVSVLQADLKADNGIFHVLARPIPMPKPTPQADEVGSGGVGGWERPNSPKG